MGEFVKDNVRRKLHLLVAERRHLAKLELLSIVATPVRAYFLPDPHDARNHKVAAQT